MSQDRKFDVEAAAKGYSPSGLTNSQVKERLEQFGENAFAKEKLSIFRTFCRQLFDPLNFILVFAAGLSLYLQEYSDSIVIMAIVLLNSFLSFVQEFRSEKAVEKLSELIKHEVLAVRDGKQVLIDVNQLVPGDTVVLRGGDVVPADIKIMECEDLSANESQLTGESIPVAKKVDEANSRAGLLFNGSVIERGYGKGVVYATGNGTELGKIAMLSKDTKKTTPYQKSISEFSFSILRIIGVTIILMLVFKAFSVHSTNDLAKVILFTVALAMTVVPEALPMIMTVNLSKGAMQLAKQKVIVKRLSAIEDLGRVNILCTDKTGTLTEDRLTITEVVSDDEEMFQKLAVASIENVKNDKHLNSFDQAFADYAPRSVKAQVEGWKKLEFLPFDPDARRRRAIVEDMKAGKTYLVAIGSSEAILKFSKAKGGRDYHKLVEQSGEQGKRQIAIAYKEIDYKPGFDILANEKDMIFLGFANMLDPIRTTAKATLDKARKLGLEIKILTGDSAEVAACVGRDVGLIEGDEKVYSGEELGRLTAAEFEKAIKECSVFARVTPEQKYDIIRRLKLDGNVVGYQGDGINDAPSLKLADASIAVKNATDVAKDSADIILLSNDLEVVINGISYGRSIFVNINKYIKHAMIGNLGSFFSLAFFYVAFSADLPMLPIQLLIGNLIQDMPLLTVVSDSVDADEVKRPLAASQVKSLTRTSLVLGVFTSFCYLAYFLFVGTAANAPSRTNLFIFFNLTQLLIIFSVRSKGFLWQGAKPSRLLLWTVMGFAAGSVAITYIPYVGDLLGFVPLQFFDLAALIAASVVFIFLLDLAKVGINKIHANLIGRGTWNRTTI